MADKTGDDAPRNINPCVDAASVDTASEDVASKDAASGYTFYFL